MKYVVNENCIGCGLCVNLCPEVFTMSDTGKSVAIETEVPAEHAEAAANAAHSCPGDAIEEA